MSDGLAHYRSTSVVETFKIIKQRFCVTFDNVIALRICMHIFAHVGAMGTAKFSFGHLQTFHVKNRKFRENAVIACAESIFTVYGKMFSSCVCYRVTDILQFRETVLGYWVRKFIGCTISSDLAVF